jgi:Ca-activated chloride channel family protein
LFLIIFIGAVRSSGQEPFTVRVDVDLVTLEVGVTDSTGRPVTTLAREDFEIYEDGKPQEIRSFAAVDTPYNVLLLFDCSGSTQPSWPFLVEAMNRFTSHLRKQDGVAVAQFGSGYKRLLNWTTVTGKGVAVDVQVGDLSCGGTDFHRALERTLGELKGSTGRKGAIVLTDGQHQNIPFQKVTRLSVLNSRYVDPDDDKDFEKTLRAVRDGGAVFYFVAVDTDLNPNPSGTGGFDPIEIYNMQQARARLELLAAASGGRVAFPKVPGDMVTLFEQIGRELGTSYGLGYTSTNNAKDGKRRQIEVRVRDRSLKVRQSREGYSR